MLLYRITGFGRETGRKRVRVYEADTQEEAFEKASKDGTIIDVAKTEIVPYPPATEKDLTYATSLGIDCPNGITQKELKDLAEEARQWASPNQLRLAKELGLELPQEKLTRTQMSELLDEALQDSRIRRRHEKLPPTKAQLKLAKKKRIKLPWRVTRQELSALIDDAIAADTKRDIAEYEKRISQDDGTVRGRYIRDNAALDALKDLLGETMILPKVKISTRIYKGNRRGSINTYGDNQAAKQVRDYYAKLLKEKGFTVTKDSSSSVYNGQKNTAYSLGFKLK